MKRFIDEKFSEKNYTPSLVEEIQGIHERNLENTNNLDYLTHWSLKMINYLIDEKYSKGKIRKQLGKDGIDKAVDFMEKNYYSNAIQGSFGVLTIFTKLGEIKSMKHDAELLDIINADEGKKKEIGESLLRAAIECSKTISSMANRRDVGVEAYSEEYGKNLKYFDNLFE